MARTKQTARLATNTSPGFRAILQASADAAASGTGRQRTMKVTGFPRHGWWVDKHPPGDRARLWVGHVPLSEALQRQMVRKGWGAL